MIQESAPGNIVRTAYYFNQRVALLTEFFVIFILYGLFFMSLTSIILLACVYLTSFSYVSIIKDLTLRRMEV